jgi:hypothetical protein
MRFGKVEQDLAVRSLMAVALCALVVALVSPVAAFSSPRGQEKDRDSGDAGCHGLVNAYAHGGSVEAVAEKHGCDLSGVTPAEHPTKDDVDHDVDSAGGPPPSVVDAKCDRIAAKLDAAEDRPHGKSADAFARQAEKWGCAN